MDYQWQTQLAAYTTHPSVEQQHSYVYLQQNPSQNSNPQIPDPNSSFNNHPHYHQPQSSQYGVASVPLPTAPPFDSSYPVGYYAAAPTTVYGGDGSSVGIPAQPTYYHDPNWTPSGSLKVYEASAALYSTPIGYAPPNGAQQFATMNCTNNLGANKTVWHQRNNNSKKWLKKIKIKVSQPVKCDVCKITCDTQDVLDIHRSGKKHKKNLEKLKAVVAGVATTSTANTTATVTIANTTATTTTTNSVILAPDMSKSLNKQTSKKKASENTEDVEIKRRKIVDCGAAVDAVRTCSICKVVCNSDTVYQFHLVGKKHASMLRKQASV